MPAIVSKIPATTKKYYQKIRETVLMMLLTILARIFEFTLRYYASNGVSSSSSLVDRRPMLKSAVIETRRCPFVRLFLIFFFSPYHALLLISGPTEKDFTRCVAATTQDFHVPPLLFIFRRATLTLPFVYAHKYSFKPPSRYLESIPRHSSGIINRLSRCFRMVAARKYFSKGARK